MMPMKVYGKGGVSTALPQDPWFTPLGAAILRGSAMATQTQPESSQRTEAEDSLAATETVLGSQNRGGADEEIPAEQASPTESVGTRVDTSGFPSGEDHRVQRFPGFDESPAPASSQKIFEDAPASSQQIFEDGADGGTGVADGRADAVQSISDGEGSEGHHDAQTCGHLGSRLPGGMSEDRRVL